MQWKNLITCLAIPLAVGSLSALLSQNGMEAFAMMSKPALSPPGWLFPVVWSILFFRLGLCMLAFVWLVVLWLLILRTTLMFYRIVKAAGYLMIPYLLWVAFAGYLNLAICLLN